jgi:hypothetical protein
MVMALTPFAVPPAVYSAAVWMNAKKVSIQREIPFDLLRPNWVRRRYASHLLNAEDFFLGLLATIERN